MSAQKNSVKKAIFCVAGYGSRFLPATKAQPKEMMPIVDKPIIQYLVEEAVEAGIEDIIFVTGRGKNSIENHFDTSFELETTLVEKGKQHLVSEIHRISSLANFAYVRQPIQKGDGDAFLCAEPFIDPNESVLVVFPDYLMPRKNNTLKRMLEIYQQHNQPVLCLDQAPPERIHMYGIAAIEETSATDVVQIKNFVEKPPLEEAPSNLINVGYYVMTPHSREVLKQVASDPNLTGEIRIANAITRMCANSETVLALKSAQPGYDCGTKSGFLRATISIGLEREDTRQELLDFLQHKLSQK